MACTNPSCKFEETHFGQRCEYCGAFWGEYWYPFERIILFALFISVVCLVIFFCFAATIAINGSAMAIAEGAAETDQDITITDIFTETSEPSTPTYVFTETPRSLTVEPDTIANSFNNAITINSLPYAATGNTDDANAVNEPYTSCGSNVGSTVWFTYTPIQSEQIIVTTVDSEFDTVLAVWITRNDEWIEIGCNDDTVELMSEVTFRGDSNTTYYIMLGGYSGSSGNFTLNISERTSTILTPLIIESENSLISGPLSGQLTTDNDAYIESYITDVNIDNFITSINIQPPSTIPAEGWDFGLLFRHTASDYQYRLIFEIYPSMSGSWGFYSRQGEDSDRLKSGNLVFDPEQDLVVQLLALGEIGLLFWQGNLVAVLDLSDRTISGDIFFATDMYGDNQANNVITSFSDFNVWEVHDAAVRLPSRITVEQGVDGYINTEKIGTSTRDFIARVDFSIPESTDFWDVGFMFRYTGPNEQYRLAITSQGRWHLLNSAEEIASGSLDLNEELDDTHSIILVAIGERGILLINNIVINEELDLSDRNEFGDIMLGSGFFADNESIYYEAQYYDINFWSFERFVSECNIRVSSQERINVRRRPGTQFSVTRVITRSNGELQAIARGRDSQGYTWWELETGGWVRSDLVSERGECGSLPLD